MSCRQTMFCARFLLVTTASVLADDCTATSAVRELIVPGVPVGYPQPAHLTATVLNR